MNGVQTDKGGSMRLEDFCDSTDRGSRLHYTSGIITMDEELLALELGSRVAGTILDWEIEHWTPLLDLMAAP